MFVFPNCRGVLSAVQRHGVALICAFFIGAVCVAPHVLAVRALGDAYRGIPFLYVDDEEIYLARMQEIADGHPTVGSAFFYEYKDMPAVQQPIGEWIYVIASKASGLSLPQTLVAAKFVLPAILFLLAYVLLLRMLPVGPLQRVGAILGGVLVILGFDIGAPLSVWTRPVNPIIGGIGVFGFLLLLWEALERRSRVMSVFAGVLLGGLVFYFFAWGIAVSVTAVLFGLYLLRKDWPRLQNLAVVLLASLISSSWYWYGALSSMGGAEGRVFAMRNGMFFTHAPLLNKTLLAALAIFLIGSWWLVHREGWKKLFAEPWWLWCVSLLIGGLAALNQQILTGREIWPYHFVQYTKPFVNLVLVTVLVRVVPARFWKLTFAGCVLLSLYIFGRAAFAVSDYQPLLPDFQTRQEETGLYTWLNENEPKDCVAVSMEEEEHLDRYISAYTHCNVYFSTMMFSGVPMERVRHNFFMHMRLLGVRAADAEAYMLTNPHHVRSAFFDNWKTVFETGVNDWLTSHINQLVPAYAEFLKQDAATQLRQYRADVLISKDPLSVEERQLWKAQNEPIQTGGYFLYTL